MNEVHLNFLANIEDHVAQGLVGKNILNFGNQVQDLVLIPEHLNQRFDRNLLFDFCADLNNTDLIVTISILAWGGMRFDHARRVFDSWEHLGPIIHQIRTGGINTRAQAFQLFENQRILGNLPGLGIGYFTKLICFTNPLLNGYILDQWSGKSINFLYDDLLIDISGSGWVRDSNTADVYDDFCLRIEEIGNELNITPLMVEERIFSRGGRNPGSWRVYLRNNY